MSYKFRLYLLLAVFFPLAASSQKLIKADESRLENDIQELGKMGDSSLGVLKRVAFTAGDLSARKHIASEMERLGLKVTIDPAGNIIGRRAGKDPSLPAIAFGSHTDAVPNGGKYDGDVGVLGGMECIRLLNENHIVTKHPIELIDFIDEEEGLIGSAAMVGDPSLAHLDLVLNSGKTLRQGILDLGGNADKLREAIRKKGELLAFLELHIEQGGNLERNKINIGVVEGIVGISGWKITIQGKTNHAGTTPMPGRKDPLVTAAKLILFINHLALTTPGRQVATVGQISAFPGGTNVIPGKIMMSLDLRDLSKSKIDSLVDLIQREARKLAESDGTTVNFFQDHTSVPAITDTRIQKLIASSAKDFGFSSQILPSGAGHDTQEMTHIAPCGMIFIPSKNGISHTPEEYSSPSDMANGASVLLRTVLKLDKGEL